VWRERRQTCGYVGGVRVWMWVWVWVWVCFGCLGGVYLYGFRSKRRCWFFFSYIISHRLLP